MDFKNLKLLTLNIDLEKIEYLPIKRYLIFDFLLRRKKGKKKSENFLLKCMDKRESLEDLKKIWINIIKKYSQNLEEKKLIKNFFNLKFNKMSLKSGESFFTLKEIENFLNYFIKKIDKVFLISYKEYYFDLLTLIYFLSLGIFKKKFQI